MPTQIIRKPVITEKSLLLANTQNVYTFEVERNANKNQIKEAIETMYQVNVEAVRTVRRHRVRKNTGRKRLKSVSAQTKKALVTLKSGQTIGLFDTYSA